MLLMMVTSRQETVCHLKTFISNRKYNPIRINKKVLLYITLLCCEPTAVCFYSLNFEHLETTNPIFSQVFKFFSLLYISKKAFLALLFTKYSIIFLLYPIYPTFLQILPGLSNLNLNYQRMSLLKFWIISSRLPIVSINKASFHYINNGYKQLIMENLGDIKHLTVVCGSQKTQFQ